MQVDFYHLSGTPVERVLPSIAWRLLDAGARLLVVTDDVALAERLDRSLWGGRPEAFLPHGRAGEGGEALQPVLISEAVDPVNGARNIALVDGLWRPEALGFDRAFLFFGEDRLEGARLAWRSLADAEGVERRFWKQDQAGRWSRQA